MSFYRKLWLSLLAFWLFWLPFGLLNPLPVIAATIVCLFVGVWVPIVDWIWR